MPGHAFPNLASLAQGTTAAALSRCAAALPEAVCLLAVDGTCGNGHDTLFLARELARHRPAGRFHLLGFDVQETALAATRTRLTAENALAGVTLVHEGHERFAEHFSKLSPLSSAGPAGAPAPQRVCAAAMYNLGFLPGSNRHLITQGATTLASLRAVAGVLAPRGVLCVHTYAGHPGGNEEAAAVEEWFSTLPYRTWAVARYSMCNKQRNPEVLFLAQRND